MKSTLDIVDILYQEIKKSSLDEAVSGGTYKYSRPLDSDKEDVVINSLPVSGDQMQKGVGNVNIHVPNLKLSIDGKVDTTQPDAVRLKDLTEIAITALENVWGEDWNFRVQDQHVTSEEKSHYSNLRVEFYLINAL